MFSYFIPFCLFVLITFFESVPVFIIPQVSSKTPSGIKSQKITSLWLVAIVGTIVETW